MMMQMGNVSKKIRLKKDMAVPPIKKIIQSHQVSLMSALYRCIVV